MPVTRALATVAAMTALALASACALALAGLPA